MLISKKPSSELLDLIGFCSIADAEVEGKHLPCFATLGSRSIVKTILVSTWKFSL
jgi:hypothetical protein